MMNEEEPVAHLSGEVGNVIPAPSVIPAFAGIHVSSCVHMAASWRKGTLYGILPVIPAKADVCMPASWRRS